MKNFEGQQLEDETGYGQKAVNALNETYDGETKEARRVGKGKQVKMKMESGQVRRGNGADGS